MSLDLPTLMIMQSFAMACSGALLCFAWMQNRTRHRVGIMGHRQHHCGRGHHRADARRNFSFDRLLGDRRLPDANSVRLDLEGGAHPRIEARAACATRWRVRWRPAWEARSCQALTASFSLAAGAAYTLATAAVLWAGREERLTARWPLIILTAVHGITLLIGTYSTFTGSTGQDCGAGDHELVWIYLLREHYFRARHLGLRLRAGQRA